MPEAPPACVISVNNCGVSVEAAGLPCGPGTWIVRTGSVDGRDARLVAATGTLGRPAHRRHPRQGQADIGTRRQRAAGDQAFRRAGGLLDPSRLPRTGPPGCRERHRRRVAPVPHCDAHHHGWRRADRRHRRRHRRRRGRRDPGCRRRRRRGCASRRVDPHRDGPEGAGRVRGQGHARHRPRLLGRHQPGLAGRHPATAAATTGPRRPARRPPRRRKKSPAPTSPSSSCC